MKYEINDETLAVLPFDNGKAKIIEKNDEYIIDSSPYSVMDYSCKYFGSSFDGRISGSKNILGSIYKAPVIVEESQKLIFFPTKAVDSSSASWISYGNIKNVEKYNNMSKIIFDNDVSIMVNCPYFSIKNQIFRCNMLQSVTENRKKSKKFD